MKDTTESLLAILGTTHHQEQPNFETTQEAKRKANRTDSKQQSTTACALLQVGVVRLPRRIYFGPMVNFIVETYYDLEILSSNMAFAVISMHSTYCQTLYFIFCIISRRLEKKFSDVRFEEQDILSKIKSTTLVLTSYYSS